MQFLSTAKKKTRRTMEINRWVNTFMTSLRRTVKIDEISFVYNKATNKFGVGCNEREFFKCSTPSSNFDWENSYYGEFEKLLNAHWILSPIHIWTRIEMYHVDVMYFAKLVDLTIHICDQYCISPAKYLSDKIFIEDSICKQVKDNFVRIPSVLYIKISNELVRFLLEFDREDSYDLSSISSRLPLRFKKLSPNAKAPVHATEGSVGYDLFSVVFKTIEPLECDVVPTDIALIAPPGVYPRITPRSSLAIKNMDVGAGIVDIVYRGNVKIVIMNHSRENHLNIEPGDKIGHFVLTRYETTKFVEVTHIDSTVRGGKGFGSSGN